MIITKLVGGLFRWSHRDNAKMQIDRDQELLGNIEGALEVGAGTTTLAGKRWCSCAVYGIVAL